MHATDCPLSGAFETASYTLTARNLERFVAGPAFDFMLFEKELGFARRSIYAPWGSVGRYRVITWHSDPLLSADSAPHGHYRSIFAVHVVTARSF